MRNDERQCCQRPLMMMTMTTMTSTPIDDDDKDNDSIALSAYGGWSKERRTTSRLVDHPLLAQRAYPYKILIMINCYSHSSEETKSKSFVVCFCCLIWQSLIQDKSSQSINSATDCFKV